jgi:hypothetical protein
MTRDELIKLLLKLPENATLVDFKVPPGEPELVSITLNCKTPGGGLALAAEIAWHFAR